MVFNEIQYKSNLHLIYYLQLFSDSQKITNPVPREGRGTSDLKVVFFLDDLPSISGIHT